MVLIRTDIFFILTLNKAHSRPFRRSRMRAYRFSIQNAAEIEELGIMALPDDAEALAFAKQIIQDMTNENRTQGSLEITDGDRVVGKISLRGTTLKRRDY